jgi:hypothetical protein
MALLSSKNIKKAKALLDKNRDKVSGVVEKGAATLDKATKGKTANVSAKATAAARKYSGDDATKPTDPSSDTADPATSDLKPESPAN